MLKFTRRTAAAAALLIAVLPTAALANRLEDVKARGTLICATLGTSEPLGFQDPVTRKTVGFDVDMCQGIADKLGVELQQKSVSVEARIPELTLGRVDLVSAALGYTPARAEQIAFTSSHYQVPIKLVVKSDSGLTSLDDFTEDKKISANKGSTPELFARKMTKAKVLTFQDAPSAFLALQQGKVNGLALSAPAALRYVNETGGAFAYVEEPLAWEPTALGVKKDEPELLAAVNDALQQMEDDGEIDAIWEKWYGPTTHFPLPREKKLTPIANFE